MSITTTNSRRRAEKDCGNLEDLAIRLADLGRSSAKIGVHQMRGETGERSFGPFLLIPAIIELSPIGGIPGVPTVIAAAITLIGVQILLGRRHLWLPQFIERSAMDGERFAKAMDSAKTAARYVDSVLRARMTWATRSAWARGIAGVVIALAATVPPLEIIPFASSLPMSAIALFGLALMARDGLVATVAMLVSLAVPVFLVWALRG
jgi:hypothetical protein